MKLIIVTAIHNRFEMTKAFLMAMDRIKRETGVETYAVVSEEDTACCTLCYQYGVKYIVHPNKPVGKKFNAVVKHLRRKDFTHIMILGSDDVPSTDFIKHCLTLKGDIIGILGMYFWGLNPRRAGFLKFGYWATNSLLGAGKILSRKVLEACDYSPWPDDANYGMDGKMMKNLARCFRENGVIIKTYKWRPLDEGLFLIDIKYGMHISSLSPIIRRGLTSLSDEKILREHLPEGEVDYLMELKRKVIIQYEEKNGPMNS